MNTGQRVDRGQRFTRGNPCPICDGYDEMPRGQGERCHGFLGHDGRYAHCSRPEHAHGLPLESNGTTYAHRLDGLCGGEVYHGSTAYGAGRTSTREWQQETRYVPPSEDPNYQETVYRYEDANGVVRYEVVRYDHRAGSPKVIRQRRPDPDRPGEYIYNLQGVERLPYRLPDLLAASVTEPILIAEGEKCVQALREHGFVATTNSEGAGKWHPELTPHFQDRHVVILLDNDEPGRVHAQKVANALHGTAASIKVLELPGLPPKGDVVDYLAAGGSADDIWRLANDALPWRPASSTSSETPSGEQPAPTGQRSKQSDPEDAAITLARLYRDLLGYDAAAECWRLYEDGAWRHVDERSSRLDSLVVEALTKTGLKRTSANRRDTLSFARRHLARPYSQPVDLLAFKNGTLEIGSGTLRDHRPSDNLTFSLPYAYTPDGVAPCTDQALKEIVPDPGAQQAIREHIGLALVGDTSFHHVILLHGGPRTGKTTILRLFNLLLGQEPDHFAGETLFRPDHEGQLQRAESRTWRGVALDEFPASALQHEELFKAMTAHSGVTSRAHHAAPLNAQWRPKLVLASNDLPRFKDASGAIAARLLVVECPSSFLGQENQGLLEALRGEVGVVAAQCIAAAQEARARGRYSVSETMRHNFEEAAAEGDPLKRFVAECCDLTVQTGQVHRVLSSELYAEWRRWAAENKVDSQSNIWLSKQLRKYSPWRITKHEVSKGTELVGIAPRPQRRDEWEMDGDFEVPVGDFKTSDGDYVEDLYAAEPEMENFGCGRYGDYGSFHVQEDRGEEENRPGVESPSRLAAYGGTTRSTISARTATTAGGTQLFPAPPVPAARPSLSSCPTADSLHSPTPSVPALLAALPSMAPCGVQATGSCIGCGAACIQGGHLCPECNATLDLPTLLPTWKEAA